MDAALHRRHWHIVDLADYQPASVAFRRRMRKSRDFLERNRRRTGQVIGKCAQSRSEHHTDSRA